MRNIKLTIGYDGTNYHGWQIQKNGVTIEEKIKEALTIITNEKVELIGASRTDSGVHALGQVANFLTESLIPVQNLPMALNRILPKDIVVSKAEEVSLDFHARFSTTGKRYKYTVYNCNIPVAIGKDYVYFYPRKLNCEAMSEACKYFIGTHDFESFSNTGGPIRSNIRTITEAKLVKNENYLEFYITGDGFLYNMVRIMVGTLIEVGLGNKQPSDIEKIILSKNRKLAGKTAPAWGLCLMEVYY